MKETRGKKFHDSRWKCTDIVKLLLSALIVCFSKHTSIVAGSGEESIGKVFTTRHFETERCKFSKKLVCQTGKKSQNEG
jgi:hypothetical protein